MISATGRGSPMAAPEIAWEPSNPRSSSAKTSPLPLRPRTTSGTQSVSPIQRWACRISRRHEKPAARRPGRPLLPPSDIGPAPQQIVIDARELDQRGMFGDRAREMLYRRVELEKRRPLLVVAHHALDPEEGGEPLAPRDWRDVVQAARRVDDHVAG